MPMAGQARATLAALHIDTLALHAGEPVERVLGSAVFPIFQCATYGSVDGGEVAYMRPAESPNHKVLGEKMAALEGTEAAVVTSSGMCAISSVLLALLRPGDHLLIQALTYGGTFEFVNHELRALGIPNSTVKPNDPASWDGNVHASTKVFYVEAICNPLTEIADISAVAKFCKEKGLVSVVDATMATPVLLQASSLGIDVVVHSATKYLNGHSDILAGVVCGTSDFIQKIRSRVEVYGGVLDPHACFLLHRGLRTLGLRVRRQNGTAAELAAFLEGHPQVERVFYPALASSPSHYLCQQLLKGQGGGLFSFEIKGGANCVALFLKGLRLAFVAPSLGGVETLVTVPAETSHKALGASARKEVGISQGLIRVSVGLEAPEDLIADFEVALAFLDGRDGEDNDKLA